jgi:PKHD-type hydroxylase
MIAVHTIPAGFSTADCDRILAQTAAAPARDAKLVGQTQNHNIRRADLVWLDDVPDTAWVMDKIIDLIRVANREVFGFDLTEFGESVQVAQYDGAREGHFDWHSDIGDGKLAAKRKLTLVAQLSSPDAYVGGALEVMPSSHVVTAQTARGTVTIFPSYLRHRVTPVTEGTRASMTVWAHGPAFR